MRDVKTWRDVRFGSLADMSLHNWHAAYPSRADIVRALIDVRWVP
jgi:hypothetical protein